MGSRALRVHRNAVEAGELRPLQPWEMGLAEYLVQHPMHKSGNVNYEELLAKLPALGCSEPMEEKALRKLIQRDVSFKRYRDLFTDDILGALRKRVIANAPEFVDAHIAGLRMAVQQQEPKSIVAFTQPMIDRVLPKRDDNAPTVAVQVVLNARQAAGLDAPPAEVEYEVVSDSGSDA